MNKRTKIATGLLLAFYIPITMFVIIITRNISFPIINPAPSLKLIPIGLSYPDTPGLTIPGTGLIASFVLASNGSIAENTCVQVANATCQLISNEYYGIWIVDIGFQQGIPWDFKDVFQHGGMYISGLSGVSFRRDFQNSSVLIPSENAIYFPVAGDFSPAIRITFFNGTDILYTYNQIKVHVLSASENEATNTNKLNLALSYALLFFSYLEGIVIIKELSKTQESDNATIKTRPKRKKESPKPSEKSNSSPTIENQNS